MKQVVLYNVSEKGVPVSFVLGKKIMIMIAIGLNKRLQRQKPSELFLW